MSLFSRKQQQQYPNSPQQQKHFPFDHLNPFHRHRQEPYIDPSYQHYQIMTPHTPPTSHNASKIDWTETTEEHIFKTELPGYSRQDVKVEIEDGKFLRITGEKKVEKEEKGDMYHRVKRSSGVFVRCFRLPENIKMDRMSAHLEHGVMTVRVPKERYEIKKPHARSITVTGY